MSRVVMGWIVLLSGYGVFAVGGESPRPAKKYFAHPAAEDRWGVIAPWYTAQNGQCDFRVRVAAETLKRYPWANPPEAVISAPHFVFSGHWAIQPDGTIVVKPQLPDWHNGDIGQRSASLLVGLVNYYRYSGDPAAIGLIAMTAEYLLDYCQTPPDHPWPRFLISCPTKGKAYGRADPRGFIQLDITAQVGSGLVAAYKLTGDPRYLEAVKHWADLLAEKCDRRPGNPPWNRYANPQDVPWDTRLTGGVSLIAQFLDDVIRLGYRGRDESLIHARDAAERYLREVLLPDWFRDPTWGHHFWDWLNPVHTCSVPCYTAQYVMTRPEAFPSWKTDVRNIVSLFFARSSVDPGSAGDVYSGAWAFPEASNCCGKSLQYPTMATAATLARFGAITGDGWAQEIARRQALLNTYDAHETGVVEDGLDGGAVVAGAWFNLAHPWPLRSVLEYLAWQPEVLGPSRENHIMRSSSVVQNVVYAKGRVAYTTSDAAAPCVDVLRLAFSPKTVLAGGRPLAAQEPLSANGYTTKTLPNGDCLLTIRHDDCRDVLVEGDDPQQIAEDEALKYEGAWVIEETKEASGGKLHVATSAGASAEYVFEGSQVRLIGRAHPEGGKADVYLDGVKQLCGIDFWCPQARHQQVVYYKNGLVPGKHALKIVARGTKNPRSRGTQVCIDAVQWSAAQGTSGFGSGGGPAEAQRVIFGYVGRRDVVDSQGHAWRPATEFVLRMHTLADLVPHAFWTEPRLKEVTGTPDPELYRYGVYGRDFTAYFTVRPDQTYHVRLKFCQAVQPPSPGAFATTIAINGEERVEDMDIAATAGGLGKAVDLVFDQIAPRNGVIAVRLRHRFGGNAMVQAMEVGPGPSPPGAKVVRFDFPPDVNHLANPGFEDGVEGAVGQNGAVASAGHGWLCRFLGPNAGIVWGESAFVQHPQSGLPKPRTGKEALRTHAQHHDAHTQVYQEVPVMPRTAYRASVWAQGVNVRGKGFGTTPNDSATLVVEELDAAGNVLAKHSSPSITRSADFQELASLFTTSEKTAKVRFVLDTVIGCRWDEGHVTYDDCALVRHAARTHPAAQQGTRP